MILRMMIPSVSLSLEDKLAIVCPPIIQFRITKPSKEKTFKMAGMIAPKYLDVGQGMILATGKITYPHENLACTIARRPSFGPKTALVHYEVHGNMQRNSKTYKNPGNKQHLSEG
jgi:hypothetical protein